MSFSNGVYTAPSGATTQVAGNVVQSATWNSINTDYAAAFNAVVSRYGLDSAETALNSAATTDLSTSATIRVKINGTTTITSLGTAANLIRIVRFAGSLLLTYNATSLILPGAANITTQAADEAIFTSDGSGNWRCVAYQQNAVSPATVPALLTAVVRTVSLSTVSTDVAVSLPLPVGVSNYLVDSIRIANATANASTATVGVFTQSAAGGTAIVTASTAVTVATSLPVNANSAQSFTINSANTESYNISPIFFRVQANSATASVDLFVTYRPL